MRRRKRCRALRRLVYCRRALVVRHHPHARALLCSLPPPPCRIPLQGGDLSIRTVLVLGFANLIADGISMGVGDFLSSKAEFEYLVSERQRELWEFENYPEGERKEMVDILCKKGIDENDAKEVIATVSSTPHKDFFIDYMVRVVEAFCEPAAAGAPLRAPAPRRAPLVLMRRRHQFPPYLPCR